MSRVRVPSALRSYTHGVDELEVAADTVGAAVQELATRFPALEPQLYREDGRLRPYVNLFVNDRDVRTLSGANTPLAEDDRLMILPSIAGGAELRAVDERALQTSMAIRLSLLIGAFVLDLPWLVAGIAALMAVGTARGHGDFWILYRLLRRVGWISPSLVQDNPEPHRFSLGVGAAFLTGAALAFFIGAPVVAWALSWTVIALTALNLFAGFCVGCAVYYWLNRVGVPGFSKAPPPGVFPGQRPR